ncbi:hypothetical protein ACFWCA_34235 [Streptomyces phaeochromogenes]
MLTAIRRLAMTCGLSVIGEEIVAAAVLVGVPESYAHLAVANGLETAVP